SPMTVAIMLVLGGIALLFVDKWFNKPTTDNSDDISFRQAFIIGCYQCLALLPGTSRSASTIVGAMTQKLTRKAAAEFSFFLALPMMFGASVVKLVHFYKEGHTFSGHEINLLIVGNIVVFIMSIIAINFFIGILTRYGFKIFGWYIIAIGFVILFMLLGGHSLQVI